jgi:hypothetical protein
MQLFIWPYIFWAFKAILRGSTVKGTCFTGVVDLSTVISCMDVKYDIGQNCKCLNISKTVSCVMVHLVIDMSPPPHFCPYNVCHQFSTHTGTTCI